MHQQIIDALVIACEVFKSGTFKQIIEAYMNQIVLSLLSGMIGVIIGSFLQSYLHKRYNRLEQKRDVLRRFVANRHFLTESLRDSRDGTEPFISLNEMFIVFADSPPVISALKKFRQELKQNQVDHILTLIKAMAIASKVCIDELDDDFISHPFTPNLQKCTSDKE